MDKGKDGETNVRPALRVNRTSSTRRVSTKNNSPVAVLMKLFLVCKLIKKSRDMLAEQTYLLPRRVRLTAVEYEVGLSLSKIQNHLAKVTIGPCKPGSSILVPVVNVDRLVDQAKSRRVLYMLSWVITRHRRNSH